ncbi:MAG: histone deacetylase [Desulfofustis sp.]|jgi:acetoin utilization deacetylase AcuC-like enzyme|nr:histone deacetylase [Desulfofustis sp.]
MMRKTAIFKNDLFLLHDPGPNHPERVDRLRVIYDFIERAEHRNKFLFPEFEPADLAQLSRNHTGRLIDRISKTSGKMYDYLDQDTATSARSYEAALLAAGSVIKGVDMLAAGDIDNGFALVRPPGHHAESDRSMGFCLFNNIAVAAHHAQTAHNMKKIMIVDWDLHHGNGTQHSFYDSDKVLYVSTHQYPFYPGTGSLQEAGVAAGSGYTVNVPLPGGMGDAEYAAIFNDIVVPVGRIYDPDLILVSAGFDIYHGDPLGSMSVKLAGFSYMTRLLVELAEQVCGGRLLVTLEGGYNLKGQRDGSLAVLSELLGEPIDEDGREFYLDDDSEADLRQAHGSHPAIVNAREKTQSFWKF